MARIPINSDPFDIEFRTKVAEYIRKAAKNIKIVTGEISAYSFLDLRAAAEEAATKGIEIDVYAKQPDQDISNRLLRLGINVYIGNVDPLEHFMIIDNSEVIVSFKKENRTIPTPIGERRAIITNESQEVKDYIKRFEHLRSSAKNIEVSGEDPLVRIINSSISH
jgi:hypothetical protein